MAAPEAANNATTSGIRFMVFDVWVALLFGMIGNMMRKLSFPIAPTVLATVLAPMPESSLQQSLLLSQGSWKIFFNRPIALVFMLLALLSILRGTWVQFKTHAPEVALYDADE